MSVLRVINSEFVKLELSKFKDISDKVCCDLAFQANEFTRWSTNSAPLLSLHLLRTRRLRP
jgi:hypothetical protein